MILCVWNCDPCLQGSHTTEGQFGETSPQALLGEKKKKLKSVFQ